MAQRLLRKICHRCKEPLIINDDIKLLIKKLKLDENHTYYHGKGCTYCFNTGYKGRTAIVEMMSINEDLIHAISQKSSIDDIGKLATKNNMKSLHESAKEKVLNGDTTLMEMSLISN